MEGEPIPYAMKKVGSKYKVFNKDTGAVHAKGTTAGKAQAQERLLRGIEHNPAFAEKIKAKVRESKA